MTPEWKPSDAFARAGRRWTPWRLLAVPLGFVCAVAVFVALATLTLRGELVTGPDSVFFCSPSRWSVVVLVMALLVLAVPIGFLLANVLLWMVPPIRRALDEAEARVGGSFSRANAGLVRATLVLALISLPVVVIAAGSSACLSRSDIYYRPHLLTSWRIYPLSQILEVRSRCETGSRGGWSIGLDVIVSDGTSLDLAVVGPWFRRFSTEIQTALHESKANDALIAPGCPPGLRKMLMPRR